MTRSSAMIPKPPSPKASDGEGVATDKGRHPRRGGGRGILHPDKELPGHTTEKIRKIAKKRLPDHDKVAAELAPLLGLGQDLLASQRAACLFQHRGFRDGVRAFEANYLDAAGWSPPLPEWRLVRRLVLPTARSISSLTSEAFPSSSSPGEGEDESEDVVYEDDDVWTRPAYPDPHALGGWDVNFHYARFVARVLAVVRDPAGAGAASQLVHWVRDAEPEDAWWVLFHALLYLQIEKVRDRAKQAPLKHRLLTILCPS